MSDLERIIYFSNRERIINEKYERMMKDLVLPSVNNCQDKPKKNKIESNQTENNNINSHCPQATS